MNIQAEKLRLIDQIALVQDEGLIKALKSLLDFGLQPNRNGVANGFGEELTATQKKRMKKSIRQTGVGEPISRKTEKEELKKKEELMRLERIKEYEASLKPMSVHELEQEVLEAVNDYKAGRFIEIEELKKQMENW